jgi:hypothetical protein
VRVVRSRPTGLKTSSDVRATAALRGFNLQGESIVDHHGFGERGVRNWRQPAVKFD